MNSQFVYQLFLEKSLDNIIEVFDCYDSRYGSIYYKNQLIAEFYKKCYTDVLKSYSSINKMKKMGLDLDSAQVVAYNLEYLRDYQDEMEEHENYNDNLNFELVVDYDYPKILHTFTVNLDSLKKIINKAQTDSSYYEFIEIFNLEL